MDDIQLKESIYYLETYGNYSLLISFYQKHGYLENAIQYLIEKVFFSISSALIDFLI